MAPRKPWAGDKSVLRRAEGRRDPHARILIVCEGKKTEPLYFKSFRLSKATLDVDDLGRRHLQVAERALQLKNESRGEYAEVWCVFDRDKNPQEANDADDFNRAIQLAQRNGIRVAYSNDAFELWFLLHFMYLRTAILRSDYVTRPDHIMPGGYAKNDAETFVKLQPRMRDAIKRAKKLLSEYDEVDPCHNDPSTTVHLLVESILSYL